MIWFYSGTPGSGKSLHAAKDIYWKLKRGGYVICNFAINRDVFLEKCSLIEKFRIKNGSIKKRTQFKKGYRSSCRGTCLELENYQLNPEFLSQYARAFFNRDKKGRIIEGQCILVLDECQLLFNARNWNAAGRDKWCSFFTQHRKYGYHIILISQFDRLVDRQIRSLIEYEIKHRKINNYKIFGSILGKLCGGSLFVAITYWYGVRERVSSEFFSAKKRYIEFYDSYKIFG